MAGGSGGGHDVSASIWAAVAVIIVGSVLMGVALVIWNWPLFWVGTGLMVVGVVGSYFVGIMDSVTEFGAGVGSEAHPG
jgi:hypothetical protein